MMDTPPELGVSFGVTLAEAAKAILIGIGSITLWLLKKLGDKHVNSLDTVIAKQDLILERVASMDTRVAVLEIQMKGHLHRDDMA